MSAGQSRTHRHAGDGEDPQEETATTPAGNAQASAKAAELDDLLDEIDSVLETNAEDFVKGFVQKGGQ